MRQTVLGVQVDNLTMAETLDRIGDFIESTQPHQHVVVNADKVVKAHRDPALARIIAACDLINADGMPVLWAAWLLGQPLKQRVTGIDLFFALLERAEQRGWRVYFLGAKANVLERAKTNALQRFPRLTLAGARDGYWHAQEEDVVAQTIAVSQPDILFVAISSPKKEQFLARHQASMRVPFAMGVGGTFDILAGLTARAPRWMQRCGLEWLFRFLQEPRRMFRRYFIEDTYFFWLLARELAHRWARRPSTRRVPGAQTAAPRQPPATRSQPPQR
jgi:N-acetylglucosaminyldiphosphoundecaprenol N-acetyl-beta-D-mannosaminyltransferase